ncbi:GerAB/ArcD/ProY family transporter [Bacillus bombysepticus]
MKNPNTKKINLIEYIIFIHVVQIAAGMLTMPSPMATIAESDAWMSVILGWGITSIIGILIIGFMQKNPTMNFAQNLTHLFGKWGGKMFLMVYAFYLFFAGFNTLLKAIEIVKVWIFPSIPSYQIAFLLLIPFFILACHGVQAITRYVMSVFFFTIFMPVFLVFALKQDFHPLHLLPVLKDGIYPVIKAMKETVTPYAGLEIAYFIYPLLQKKEKAMIGIFIANTGTMFSYLFITILCYLYFSAESVKEIIWPVFQVLKGIRFPFLERLEIIYIAYYLTVFSTTIYPYLFFSINSIKDTFRGVSIKWLSVSYIILLIFIFTVFHPKVTQFLLIYSIMDFLNFIFFILFPVLLFICSSLLNWSIRRN